jgi:hypothetical protein
MIKTAIMEATNPEIVIIEEAPDLALSFPDRLILGEVVVTGGTVVVATVVGATVVLTTGAAVVVEYWGMQGVWQSTPVNPELQTQMLLALQAPFPLQAILCLRSLESLDATAPLEPDWLATQVEDATVFCLLAALASLLPLWSTGHIMVEEPVVGAIVVEAALVVVTELVDVGAIVVVVGAVVVVVGAVVVAEQVTRGIPLDAPRVAL